MKNTLLICCLAISFLFPNLSSAQWMQTNGPYGANVKCFAQVDSTLFVGTHGSGIYKSTDNGNNWIYASQQLTDTVITALASVGRTVLAVTDNGNLYSSNNNGNSWEVIDNTQIRNKVYKLAVSRGIIYVAIYKKGVFSSKDNGTTWTQNNNGMDSLSIQSLYVYDSTVYAISQDGIYTLDESKIQWSKLSTIVPTVMCVKEGKIIIGKDPGIFISNDNGKTWLQTQVVPSDIISFAVYGWTIIASSRFNGAYISSDRGDSWKGFKDKKNPLATTQVQSFFVSGSTIFAGTFEGIYKSTDGGDTWATANNGLINLYVTNLAKRDSILYAGTDIGLYSSNQNTTTWTLIGPKSWFVTSVIATNNSIITSSQEGIYRTTNNGTNWEKISWGLNNNSSISCMAMIDSIIFAGSYYDGVFVSSNNGNTWTKRNNGLGSLLVFSLLTVGSTAYAGVLDPFTSSGFEEGGVYSSSDFGNTWTRLGAMNYATRSLSVKGKTLLAGTSKGAFYCDLNGSVWNPINEGLSDTTIYTLCVSEKITLCGKRNGVFGLANNKNRWSDYSDGLTTTNFIRSLIIKDSIIFAGTAGYGVWRRPLSELLTSAEEPTILPEKAELQQNYPNPATADTKITFSLPAAGFTTLKVFNALGQEVTTLLAEDVPAGTHTATWNVSNSQSGTYFCRLQSGAITETMKLTVVR